MPSFAHPTDSVYMKVGTATVTRNVRVEKMNMTAVSKEHFIMNFLSCLIDTVTAARCNLFYYYY